VVVGDDAIEDVIISINNVQYKAQNILRALDLIIKCIMTLNLEYSAPCRNIYQFFQVHVYGITTAYDELRPCISMLIKNLEML